MAAAPIAAVQAAELKVIAGGGMTAPLKELGPQFERATGHKVDIAFAATPELIKMATSGNPMDLAVVPVNVMQDAGARARFAPEPTIDIARVGFGVAVKAGATKPDVSTPDALKQTLLKTQSIAFLPASAAGAYVMKVFDRLGVKEQMMAKTRAQKTPGDIPKAVANGEAELGIFLTNVLIAPGVELAGSFPGDLQNDLVFTAAVATESKEKTAARAFLDFLKTPEAVAVIKAKGMQPG
ncbi:MAG TPA: molybdate ABC transporter substrate-binding protein [Pseudolabrys sp.]|nr:molybdate ABC transporter substrate-binding protein [Pseudolabrys sp.]